MFKFDVYNRPEPETFYLCKPDGTPICELNGIDADTAEMQINLNNQYELTFDYDRWINTLDGELVESNGYFDLTVEMRILVKSLGYFVLKYPPYEYDGDRERKSVTAYSCECELEKKDLVGFKINTGETDSLEYLVSYDDDEDEELLNAYTGLPYDYIMFDNTYPAQLQELLGKYNDGTTVTNAEKVADIKSYCDLVPRLKSRLVPETVIDEDGDEYEDYQLVEFVEYTYDDDGNVKSIYLFPADSTNEYQVGFNGRIEQLIEFYTKYHDQLSLVPLAIEKCSCNWSVGEIDPSLANKKFQFDVDSENIYSFLTNDVASVANCVFTFDLFNKNVNAILVENIGEDSGIVLARNNLLDTVQVTCDDDNVFTRYNVSGADDLTITQVNFGSSRLDDLTYFLNVRDNNNKRIYVTDDLATKYYQFAEDRELARDVYVAYTKEYNQLLIDIDELKYRVPNDVVQTDWDTFTLTELEEALKTYKNLLATLVSLYKEDYGSAGVNSDGSVKDQFIRDTMYWYDYYAYTVAIEQIEAAYEAKARDETYADIDNEKILEQINAWETEWSLYGTVELQNKIDAYNNQMKVLIDSGAVVTKYPPKADYNCTCVTQGTDELKEIYVSGSKPSSYNGIIIGVDFSFKHSRSGGVRFRFTFEDGTVVTQSTSVTSDQEWTWFAGDTLYFKFTSNSVNSLELIEDNGEIYSWDELYYGTNTDLTDDERNAYLTEYMYMQINYHDEEYMEAYNLRNECQEYLDTLMVELEALQDQLQELQDSRTPLINLTTIEGYNRVELGKLVDLEDCPDSYVSATCDTEDGVILKEVTITDGRLSDGSILAITFTYAQTKSTGVYFEISGNAQDEEYITSQKFTWDAGDTLYFVYHTNESFETALIAFTAKEVRTISMLYMDVDYSNENIITTSLDTVVTAIDAQLELLDDAREQLSISSQPQIEFTTEIDNLLAMAEFRDFDFTVGNYTAVEYYDDYIVKLRLYTMKYNPCIPESELEVTFTNFIRSRSERSDLSYILEQASGVGSGGGSGGSGSGVTYGADIDATISDTMLAQLLNSETFGTRVSNIILDTIDVNSLYSRTATFGGLGNGFTKVNGNCVQTGYIVSTNYDGITTTNSNGVITNRSMTGFSTGSIIDLDHGTFNFGAGKFTGEYDDTYSVYTVTVEGVIKATKGEIGGFNIGENSIYSSVDGLGATSSNGNVYISPTGISLGSNFIVYPDGTLTAKDATITGTVTATSGKIGNWYIVSGRIKSSETISIGTSGTQEAGLLLVNEDDKPYIVAQASGGTAMFRVDRDGSVYVNGTITAGSGSKIGGWTISENKIYNAESTTNDTAVIQKPSSNTTNVFAAGGSDNSDYGDCPFRVTKTGDLYSTSFNLDGAKLSIKNHDFQDISYYLNTSTGAWSAQSVGAEADCLTIGNSSGVYIEGEAVFNAINSAYVESKEIMNAGNLTTYGSIYSKNIYVGCDNGVGLSYICTASSGESVIRIKQNWSSKQISFGIGSGGDNRGIYDDTFGGWMIYDLTDDGNKETRLPIAANDSATGTANVWMGNAGRLRLLTGSSSIRYKNIISEMECNEVDKYFNLPIYWFTYKTDYVKEGDERYMVPLPGFLAEEWNELLPAAVDHNENGECEVWNNNIVVPIMFEMIKNNHEEIQSLKDEIAELKSATA